MINENQTDVVRENEKVVFMTAYNVNEYKKNWVFPFKKNNIRELLAKYHIANVSAKDTLFTEQGKFKIKSTFSHYKQTTNFEIESENTKEQDMDYDKLWEEAGRTILLKHSEKLLYDSNCFNVSFVFEMESFLVKIENRICQIDAWGFLLNGMVIIVYEVLNYETGKALNANEIFGPHNNYNIIPVDEIMYFEEQAFLKETRRVSEVIYSNITEFLESLLKHKYKVDEFSFIHNILVLSNSTMDVEKYFKDVLGVEEVELQIKNLNTTDAFKYFSQEYLGLITEIQEDAWGQAESDCILLEAMKMYLCLRMIVGYEIKDKLDDTIDNQLDVERLFYPSHVPIITMNVLDSIKETQSFNRYKAANDFKISYFKLMQERKKNKNNLFLNILLYLLALISGIGTLQVLQTEFGWPFKISFVILILIFVGLGIFWVVQERNDRN